MATELSPTEQIFRLVMPLRFVLRHGTALGILLTLAPTHDTMAQRSPAQQRFAERLELRLQDVRERGTSIDSPANEVDSLALVEFYEATGGINWTINSGWLTGPVAQWYGVTLGDDGRVTELNLPSNGLTGGIPYRIRDLAYLTVLELSDNGMFSSIPDAVLELADLRVLSLWNNRFVGTIPEEIGRLSKLEDCLLSGNSIEGEIPDDLATIAGLDRLWLDFNELTGPVPPELADLQELTELFLDDNQLTGSLPPELAELPNLASLYVGYNLLNGEIPPELGNLPRLQNLSLAGNRHDGTIPPDLSNIDSLTTLDLGGNQLTGEIPYAFGALELLTTLDLSQNALSGSIPPSIATYSLSELRLRRNRLSGTIPTSLSEATGLRQLDLGDNRLSGEIPLSLGSLENLEYLDLSGNAFSGSLEAVGSLFQLRELRLRGNLFSGNVPEAIMAMPLLRFLDIGQNLFEGDLEALFRRPVRLHELWMDGNLFAGSVPATLAEARGLGTLVMSDNTFDQLPSLTALTDLDSISVASNVLTFEDLEPNAGLASGNFTYAPQDSVELTVVESPGRFVFSVDVGGSQNQYRWYRNGVRLQSSTADTLEVDANDAAAYYRCEITNTLLPKLTLTSRVKATGTETATEEPKVRDFTNAFFESWPNPATGPITISFEVAERSHMRLRFYDALGRELARVVDRVFEVGRHEVTFDAATYSAGLYFWSIEIGAYRASHQLLIVR